MPRHKKAKLSEPEAAENSLLPDELILRIFLHCPVIDRMKQLPLVCKRWRNLCSDKVLWKVIQVDPTSWSEKSMKQLMKIYAGKHTKILRICQCIRQVPNAPNRDSKVSPSTWKVIMSKCTNIEELYLESLNMGTFKQFYQLPATLKRLYIVDCCCFSSLTMSYMFRSMINHKALEVINIRQSRSFFIKSPDPSGIRRDLSVFKTINKLKYVGIKEISSPNLELINLENMIPMNQLTHLEMNGYEVRLHDPPFKTILKGLSNLLKLNITKCSLRLEDSVPANYGWADMWEGTVPDLKVVKLCGLRLLKNDEQIYWFYLDEQLSDRENLTVIGCRIAYGDEDLCESPMIIPSPTTSITPF